MPDYSDPSANFPDSIPRELAAVLIHDDPTDRDSANPDEFAGAHARALANEIIALANWADANKLAGGYVSDAGGLDVDYTAGRIRVGDGAPTSWSAGTLTLTDNATSYVEVDAGGTVSANTTGFSDNAMPLATVTTSSGDITGITDQRAAFEMPDVVRLIDRGSDPADPASGESVMWQSDGTGSGADGDIMMKITDSGGTTKTTTLVDFSAV